LDQDSYLFDQDWSRTRKNLSPNTSDCYQAEVIMDPESRIELRSESIIFARAGARHEPGSRVKFSIFTEAGIVFVKTEFSLTS